MRMPRLFLQLLLLFLLAACSDQPGNLRFLPERTPKSVAPAPQAKLESMQNSLGMSFVRIPGGDFSLGLAMAEGGRADEQPIQAQTRIKSLYFGVHEVTQTQWKMIMGTNPSAFQPDDWRTRPNSYNSQRAAYGFIGNEPVENISWFDAQQFVQRLNAREGTSSYRLPTEAEWEYVARVGGTINQTPLNKAQWAVARGIESYFSAGRGGITFPVGSFPPNAWGVHDLEGNVREWCQDVYAPYGAKPADGVRRVNRGNCWLDPQNTRLTERYCNRPDYKSSMVGLRIVKSID